MNLDVFNAESLGHGSEEFEEDTRVEA